MNQKTEKRFVIPVSGSQRELKFLAYLHRVFGAPGKLKIILCHILPPLPSVLAEGEAAGPGDRKRFKALGQSHRAGAEQMLSDMKQRLLAMGFSGGAVETAVRECEVGVARDIYAHSEQVHAHALCVATRRRLTPFFTGKIACKLQEICQKRPVWILKGSAMEGGALVAVDNSKNALRMARHAGEMLAKTDCPVTLFHARCSLEHTIGPEMMTKFPELRRIVQNRQKQVMAPYMEDALHQLTAAGIQKTRITVRVIDTDGSTPDAILDAARSADAGMLFIGRRGHAGSEDYTMGSVARRVLERAAGIIVCLVP